MIYIRSSKHGTHHRQACPLPIPSTVSICNHSSHLPPTPTSPPPFPLSPLPWPLNLFRCPIRVSSPSKISCEAASKGRISSHLLAPSQRCSGILVTNVDDSAGAGHFELAPARPIIVHRIHIHCCGGHGGLTSAGTPPARVYLHASGRARQGELKPAGPIAVAQPMRVPHTLL
jgi:hypothetical protein